MDSMYHLVRMDMAPICGIRVEIDEKALLQALLEHVEKAKDRWNPTKTTSVRLVPDPASFKQEP